MKFPHYELMRTAGPFDTWMQRDDAEGTAVGRLEKGRLLEECMMNTVLAMGYTRAEGLRACIRINLLLEKEMDTLLDDRVLKQWCEERVKHFR